MADSIFDNALMNEFIKTNSFENTDNLLLKYHSKHLGFPLHAAIIQIECRQKIRRKLSRFIGKDNFLFPTILSAEQATHQCVAAYHAYLIGSEKSVADLTAGLGIDAISFALNGNKVTALELDPHRAEYLAHNSLLWDPEILASGGSISIHCYNSLDWLEKCGRTFDLIYVDPARRDRNLNRVFVLEDCLPDVVAASKLLMEHGKRIFIKSSPLLDIKKSITDLPNVKDIKVVCVNGECKEVLLIIEGIRETDRVGIEAVDLRENSTGNIEFISRWSCFASDCNELGPIVPENIIVPGSWIYDPNAGIHKLRTGKLLCDSFPKMYQMGNNTDLFISPSLYPEFPGRIFKIKKIPDKKDLKSVKGSHLEVISRNFPMRASDIRKKYNLEGSSDMFMIAGRTGKQEVPKMYLCTKFIV